MSGILKALGKIERKVAARMRGIVRRAVLSNLQAGSAGQTGQTTSLADDARDGVELFEPYGFTSSPQSGAECLVFRVGGDSAHQVALAAGSRSVRLVVAQGEVAVYHEGGSHVWLRNDGSIEVYPEPGQVVRLGGAEGALPIARETDPVMAAPDFQAWVTAVSTALATVSAAFNVAGPLVGAPGTVLPTTIADMVAPSDFGLIESGGEGSEST